MKIVQLTSVHYVFDTRIFHKISKSLVKAGYSVDLIAQHQKNEIVDGVKIIALPTAKKKSDRPLKVIPSLFKKAIQYPPNTVFHFHDPELIPIGLLLKWFGYTVIYDIHEDVPDDILDKDWIPLWYKKWLIQLIKFFEKLCALKLDYLITVTKGIQRKLYGETLLIQNFPLLDEMKHENTVSQKEDSIFYVGNITQVRGISEMLKAVELVNEHRKLKFIIGGDFSDSQIEEKANEEKGWKYVDYHSWLSREEIAIKAEESIAGLVIFYPIKSHINAQPNKLFEYMMHGLPVIASDFPLWKEIVEGNNCGILVDPKSPKEIASAIDWILGHPEEARKMGENGRKAVLEKYNWANEEEKLLKLYDQFKTENN